MTSQRPHTEELVKSYVADVYRSLRQGREILGSINQPIEIEDENENEVLLKNLNSSVLIG